MKSHHRWHSMLLGLLLVLTTWGVAFVFGICQDACNDAWPHALHGRILWEEGRFPRFSDYSFVPNQDIPHNSDAVVSVLLYLLLHYFGYAGLLLFKVCGGSALVVVLWLWMRQAKVPHALIAISITATIIVAQERFFPRGDLFNLVFVPLYLYILDRYHHNSEKDKSIWWLALWQWVWIQLHYLACLGLFLIGVYAAAEIWQGWRQKKTMSVWSLCQSRLVLVGLAALALSFVNESGYRKVLQPFGVLQDFSSQRGEVYTAIGEFQPLISNVPDGTVDNTMWALWREKVWAISCILMATLFLLNYRGLRLPHLLLWLTFALAALRFVRFIGLYAVITGPLIGIYVGKSLQNKVLHLSKPLAGQVGFDKMWQGSALLLNIFVIWLVSSNTFFKWFDRPVRCNPTLSPIVKPVRAVEFLQRHHIYGNTYSNYDIGGFVAYQLYPRSKIFIHSLSLWYSFEHFLLFKQIWSGALDIELLADAYNIDIFILSHTWSNERSLCQRLYLSNQWLLIHVDENNLIYLRRNCELGKRCTSRVVDPGNLSPENTSVLENAGYASIGDLCMMLGHYPQAQAFYEKALALHIHAFSIYNNLALIAMQSKNYQAALRYFLDACELELTEAIADNVEKLLGTMPASQRHTSLYRRVSECLWHFKAQQMLRQSR